MTQPRLMTPDRRQMRLVPTCLDQVLPEDAPARAVWAYVEHLDLSVLYKDIKAVEGAPGRPAIDPRLLLALWIFATSEGVGSARQIARLCERDLAYRWLCGDVGVNYHALADFRAKNAAGLEQLLTRHVAALASVGVVQLKNIVQDGVRVRASAGSASFRRRARLEDFEREAAELVAALKKELEDAPESSERRHTERLKGAALRRHEKLQQALKRAQTLEEKREKTTSHKSKAEQAKSKRKVATGDVRASTTDPDAHRMKMADGGYRPAYNEHVAVDPNSGFIVATLTTNEGLDGAMLPPMIEKITKLYDVVPDAIIADGGFVTKDAIDRLYSHGVKVIAPVDKPRSDRDPHTRLRGDSEGVALWREGMGEEQNQDLYALRPIVEWIFARYRNWNVRLLRVRSLPRVRSGFLLNALTHNVLHDISRRRGGLRLSV